MSGIKLDDYWTELVNQTFPEHSLCADHCVALGTAGRSKDEKKQVWPWRSNKTNEEDRQLND